MIRQCLSTILGKTVQKVARLRGGGSALPGLVIEKIDPKFMARSLSQLPLGVVVISGTNGKTTTTKIVVELLESTGLKVFTNKTGSNFSRGVVAEILNQSDLKGRLNADIAVLELDEAWAVKFAELVKPRFCLLLNVSPDQLDRFGDVKNTAKLLAKLASQTTEAVILNRDDPLIYQIANQLEVKKRFFGTTKELLSKISDSSEIEQLPSKRLDVTLKKIKNKQVTFEIDSQDFTTEMSLTGIHNALNAVAGLSLVRQILESSERRFTNTALIEALAKVKPAFGRGEVIKYGDSEIELILVKNPSGFRLAMTSRPDKNIPTMIAINNNYADGQDISWLWDVDFSSLKKVAMVSGSRASDMTSRLTDNKVEVKHQEPDIKIALNIFLEENSQQNLRIFSTYTAMLTIRKELSKRTSVEKINC